jgi:4-amino-4-deoxy-L-arabinose transferase-like glycosyltransferase
MSRSTWRSIRSPAEQSWRTRIATGRTLLPAIFLGALALRWVYTLTIWWVMGDAGLKGSDSIRYLLHGQRYAEAIASGTAGGWQWLGLDPFMLPLFNLLLGVNILLFGPYGALAYVLCQGAIDAATCLVIAVMARELDARLAIPAAIAAAVNPTQIVVAGLIYPDTGFLLCMALALLGAIRWLRAPSWQKALLVGAGLGGAAMFRILVVVFVPALMAFLLIVTVIRNGIRARPVAQLLAASALFGVCIGTVSLRNATQYGSWALTPQSGVHLAGWVVPLIKQARDGTPWATGQEEIERRMHERFGFPSSNPFVQSRNYLQLASEDLATFSTMDLARAWGYGAVINLGTPAIILSPPILQLPRTGFYGTPGATMPAKMWNFLFRSDSALYAWVLLIGIAGVAAIRLVQLCGLAAILGNAKDFASLLLLAGWCAFILLINGPVAQPQYRLPLEPVLCVLTAAGWSGRRTGGRVGYFQRRYHRTRGQSVTE